MNISLTQPIGIGQVAGLYTKNSAPSLTNTRASDALFDVTQAEIVHALKKSLLLAIDSGNFEKALFILMRLKELGILS